MNENAHTTVGTAAMFGGILILTLLAADVGDETRRHGATHAQIHACMSPPAKRAPDVRRMTLDVASTASVMLAVGGLGLTTIGCRSRRARPQRRDMQ